MSAAAETVGLSNETREFLAREHKLFINGEWTDACVKATPPSGARVGVIRNDFKEVLWGFARFQSYAAEGKNGLTMMWKKMPEVMIAKCAEALALRKAFPQELSGLYTSDEMAQAQTEAPVDTKPEPKNVPAATTEARKEAYDVSQDDRISVPDQHTGQTRHASEPCTPSPQSCRIRSADTAIHPMDARRSAGGDGQHSRLGPPSMTASCEH